MTAEDAMVMRRSAEEILVFTVKNDGSDSDSSESDPPAMNL